MDGQLIEGDPSFDDPVLDPVVVSTLGSTNEENVDRALLMAVALDPEGLPGLAEAFQLHRTGHRFDVESQWSVLVSSEVSESPTAYLHIHLLDIDLRFIIRFVVDDYKRSLTTAAQTGLVELWEPDLAQAMLTTQAEEAYEEHGAIGITPGDPEPLRRVLQQRFDLPLTQVREQPQVVARGETEQALQAFTRGAAQPDAIGLVTSPGFVAVMVVDARASEVLENAGPEAERWGNWASMRAGPISLARVDVLTGEKTRLGSWLIPNPSPEVIRATSAGAHVIVVLTEPPPADKEALRKVVSEGTAFPVRSAPDAMRALRLTESAG